LYQLKIPKIGEKAVCERFATPGADRVRANRRGSEKIIAIRIATFGLILGRDVLSVF